MPKAKAKTKTKTKPTRAPSAGPRFELDRLDAVPALVGDHRDFLIVAGLAGTARDIAALTDDGRHTYAMAGAMGAATAMGLGLALARPDRRVLVITGDGELLMNVGSLATAAVLNPPNLSIVCVDNGYYGETGYQQSHTSLGVDLERIAAGSGIAATRTVETADQIEDASRLLREGNGTSFVLLRVKPTDPPAIRRIMDPAACRVRFRENLLGHP
ncbi:MAG: thiamine pyrophosphate-binding protein [Ectothiorhodospiraceae bacterium]|nr:thiamine pyrophosphate-binding protein [Ectothiorhodospiraceae bacterium]